MPYLRIEAGRVGIRVGNKWLIDSLDIIASNSDELYRELKVVLGKMIVNCHNHGAETPPAVEWGDGV